MNTVLILLFISTGILVLSAITISLAPIINDISNMSYNSPKDLDCEIFSNHDEISKGNLALFQKLKTYKNICKRQKATHNLEYSSLIINAVLSFICANFALLSFFKEGENHRNKIGLIGLITGIIGFVLTLVYVCFSGYVFTHDVAYGIINMDDIAGIGPNLDGGITKLFSNGAKYKYNGKKYITPYEANTEYNSKYIRYKDLGDKQYNYDSELYKKYFLKEDSCFINDATKPSSRLYSCDYIFYGKFIKDNNSNKYLYDRWLVTLVLSCFIFLFNICLSFFGFLIFKEEKDILETANVNYDTNSFKNIIQFNPKNNDEINANNNPN